MHPEQLTQDFLNLLNGVCYVVAVDGTILNVGPDNWCRFMETSRTVGPKLDAVLGHNLFDFVEGEEVRDRLRCILDRLASGEFKEWVMPFRCDTPVLKRNMRLSISPIMEGVTVTGFLFQSILLDAEARPPVDLFRFDAASVRLADLKQRAFLLMCNWCQRVKMRDEPMQPFVEGPEYYRRGGTHNVSVFHTVCPDCRQRESEGFLARGR